MRRRGLIAASACIVLAAATAAAQPRVGTVTESVTLRRDVNGRDSVSEKVVTHRDVTDDGERVVVDIYLPAIEAGQLALRRRVNRVTTATSYGVRTVEDTEEQSPAAPAEPLRVVRRTVTTVRTSGADSRVSERQYFERDPNGRFVLVNTQIERLSRE
jgi:hypothetical protein